MILDSRLEFADATSIVHAVGTWLVGNVVDLGGVDQIGGGDQLYLVIQVDTSVAATGGAATVSFALASDDNAAIATDGSATIHYQSKAIAKGSLTAGTYVAVVEVPMVPAGERYLGILATAATNDITTGKINAFLTADVSAIKNYPNAI